MRKIARFRGVMMFVIAGTLALGAAAGLAAPGDMIFERPGASEDGPFPPAIFPHWVHRARFRCYVCHPAIFEMKQGANPATMEQINNGESCGVCHNGLVGFDADFESCARCHRNPGE